MMKRCEDPRDNDCQVFNDSWGGLKGAANMAISVDGIFKNLIVSLLLRLRNAAKNYSTKIAIYLLITFLGLLFVSFNILYPLNNVHLLTEKPSSFI